MGEPESLGELMVQYEKAWRALTATAAPLGDALAEWAVARIPILRLQRSVPALRQEVLRQLRAHEAALGFALAAAAALRAEVERQGPPSSPGGAKA